MSCLRHRGLFSEGHSHLPEQVLNASVDGGSRWRKRLDDAEGYGAYMARYRGPVAEFMDDTLMLSDDEARELLTEIRGVWRRFQHKQRGSNEKPYFFQFAVVPLEP